LRASATTAICLFRRAAIASAHFTIGSFGLLRIIDQQPC
jgi:hypothetical protein